MMPERQDGMSNPLDHRERDRWDLALAEAMQDVPVPEGLHGRLRQAVSATVAGPEGTASSSRSRLSRRRWWPKVSLTLLLLLTVAATGWWWNGPQPVQLTDLPELPDNGEMEESRDPLLARWPEGWGTALGLTSDRPWHTALTTGRWWTQKVTSADFTFRSSGGRVVVQGRIFAVPRALATPVPTKDSFPQAEVQYRGEYCWASWQSGRVVYVVVIQGHAGMLADLQRAVSAAQHVS